MYISDTIVFVELHKTGCTHIGRLLADLVPGQQVGKHNRFTPGPVDPAKTYLGSVRNPWSWYLSLWAFGCDHRGALYLHATRPRLQLRQLGYSDDGISAVMQQHQSYSRHPDLWRENYSDVRKPEHFRRWLHMLFHPEFIEDVGESFSQCPLARDVGLMTFRYINLFWRDQFPEGVNSQALCQQDAQQCYIDHFIRNESLEKDFLQALDQAHYPLTQQQKQAIFAREHSNKSSARDESVQYYDRASAELVAQRDRLIIEKFGYRPPAI